MLLRASQTQSKDCSVDRHRGCCDLLGALVPIPNHPSPLIHFAHRNFGVSEPPLFNDNQRSGGPILQTSIVPVGSDFETEKNEFDLSLCKSLYWIQFFSVFSLFSRNSHILYLKWGRVNNSPIAAFGARIVTCFFSFVDWRINCKFGGHFNWRKLVGAN